MPNQLRPVKAEVGTLYQVDGSAQFSQGKDADLYHTPARSMAQRMHLPIYYSFVNMSRQIDSCHVALCPMATLVSAHAHAHGVRTGVSTGFCKPLPGY